MGAFTASVWGADIRDLLRAFAFAKGAGTGIGLAALEPVVPLAASACFRLSRVVPGSKGSWRIEARYRYRRYEDFLGQVQVFVPIGETVGSDASVIAMVDRNRDPQAEGGGNAASKGQERYWIYQCKEHL